MRLIVGITLLLLGIGMWSCQVKGTTSRNGPYSQVGVWVRTADGWERSDSWQYGNAGGPPRLHPLVVAAGQGLVSLLGLVAFGRDED